MRICWDLHALPVQGISLCLAAGIGKLVFFPGFALATPAGEATWWLADLGRDGGAWVDGHTG